MKKIFISLLTVIFFVSASAQSNITLHFTNKIGGQPIALHQGQYTNVFNEQFSIDLLQYFITNIQFEKADGSMYTVPQDSSYFLIKEADSTSRTITLQIPNGKYKAVHFLLGIDSLRNTLPIAQRKGVLDPASYKGDENMYWGWNSGYIFFKMEGTSNAAAMNKSGTRKYLYHIGLYGGMNTPTINNIKKISLGSIKKASFKVSDKKEKTLEIEADILALFSGYGDLKIAEHTVVMVNPFSAVIANNYASMFRLTSIK